MALVGDEEAAGLLIRACDVLEGAEGATVRAQTALEAARRALVILTLGLEQATAEDSETVPGLLPQSPEP